jgi:hypothetical protein
MHWPQRTSKQLELLGPFSFSSPVKKYNYKTSPAILVVHGLNARPALCRGARYRRRITARLRNDRANDLKKVEKTTASTS